MLGISLLTMFLYCLQVYVVYSHSIYQQNKASLRESTDQSQAFDW